MYSECVFQKGKKNRTAFLGWAQDSVSDYIGSSQVQIDSIQGKLSTKTRQRLENKRLRANLWKPSTKAENESRVQKLQASGWIRQICRLRGARAVEISRWCLRNWPALQGRGYVTHFFYIFNSIAVWEPGRRVVFSLVWINKEQL